MGWLKQVEPKIQFGDLLKTDAKLFAYKDRLYGSMLEECNKN